ncbi:ABC transporter ATP-binding protein [Rhodoplanes sp.]|uniref:ABC transporter ATP-binding protein n=1 Tax=Rhodoplanes sp. TaxID=1968906 RepID=UPI002600D540|nr:ABC transporter ATP-binding protein [Rhodoplanes sp.]
MDHRFLGGGLKNAILNLPRMAKYKRPETYVLQDLSFEIRRGTTVAFVGRNGAGKSTLLGLIAGVLVPSTGRVSVYGKVSSLLELGAGFHPDLTGRENIELYGIVLGFRRAEILRRLDAIVDFAELREHIDTPVRFYSSGMLARLGFAVVSQLDPEILIVDEVLAVGDFSFQAKCYDVINRFRADGGTIVMVSHSASDVVRLCDEAHLIEDHRIVASGEPREVIRRYQPELVI